MSGERLRVFISGKERECDDERELAIEAIEQLHMNPQASERRGASPLSIRTLNLGRVRNSDVYIGIFGKCDSEPSREEYEKAKENKVPRLVYTKELRSDEKRDPELEKFLEEVRHSTRGITVGKYKNARVLREEIKRDISEQIINPYYRKGVERELRETSKAPSEATIEFSIPSAIVSGAMFPVSASTIATVGSGFLDIGFFAPNGQRVWFPDPKSWKRESDTGSLELENEEYKAKWYAKIPSSWPEGHYHAMIGLYDDDIERKLIAKREKSVFVKKPFYSGIISRLNEFIIRWPVYKRLMSERKLKSPENGEMSWYATEITREISALRDFKEKVRIQQFCQDLAILGSEVHDTFPATPSTTDREITELVSRGKKLKKLAEDIIKALGTS